MNKQTRQAIAYSQNFLSFIFLKTEIKDHIKGIYLYGSAVRGNLFKDSDIDIFIDCNNKEDEKRIEKICKSALTNFYNSKDYQKWKLFSFTYPIVIHAGKLSEWELKTSILAEGIQLYSDKTRTELREFKRKVLFTIKLPKDKKRYLKFTRKFFGRKEENYTDKGILGEIKGQKFASNVFIVNKEYHQKIEKILQEYKIDYSFKEIAVFA